MRVFFDGLLFRSSQYIEKRDAKAVAALLKLTHPVVIPDCTDPKGVPLDAIIPYSLLSNNYRFYSQIQSNVFASQLWSSEWLSLGGSHFNNDVERGQLRLAMTRPTAHSLL